jgi:iron complex transport system substrate-binding protein
VRIVSLLPAATEIVIAIGLEDELVGVSDRSGLRPDAHTSTVVTGDGSLDPAALVATRPELVLVGDGPSHPGSAQVRAALAAGGLDADVLTLAPATVEGVLNAISTVGAMTATEDAAMDVVEQLRERLRALEEVVVGRRDNGFRPPRVVVLDGLEPPRAVGSWVPDQVRLAGGWELLGREGSLSRSTTWAAVGELDPQVLVLAPAELRLVDAIAAWDRAPRPDAWTELPAVAAGRVFVVDGTCFSWPGPRVVDGIEILAELIDPAAFDGLAPPATWARAR